MTAALAPPEILGDRDGHRGDAFTEVGAPRSLVGTLVGGGRAAARHAVTLAAAPVASELVVALTERV